MSQDELLERYGVDRPLDVIQLPNGHLRVVSLWYWVLFKNGFKPHPYLYNGSIIKTELLDTLS